MLLIAGWVQLDASFLWLLCCGKFSFTCAYALDAMLLKMILILHTHTIHILDAALLKILCAGAHILGASLLKGRLHTYLMLCY